MLTGLQDNTDWHVAVVFDGAGTKTTGATSGPRGIQVFYSTADQSADSVIERLAAKYAERYEVTVATDDLMERTTVATSEPLRCQRGSFARRLKRPGAIWTPGSNRCGGIDSALPI